MIFQNYWNRVNHKNILVEKETNKQSIKVKFLQKKIINNYNSMTSLHNKKGYI